MTNARSKSAGRKPAGKSRNQKSAPKTFGDARPEGNPGELAGTTTSHKPTKLDHLIGLLNRPDGASIAELTEATGWQAHSVRGAMSGALKRKGLTVTSEVTDGVRRYWIGASA